MLSQAVQVGAQTNRGTGIIGVTVNLDMTFVASHLATGASQAVVHASSLSRFWVPPMVVVAISVQRTSQSLTMRKLHVEEEDEDDIVSDKVGFLEEERPDLRSKS
jgi:hypothetical protein